MSRLNKSNRAPLLCYVTDRRNLAGIPAAETTDAVLHKIELAVRAGIDWIQLREKDLSGRDYSALTRKALQLAAGLSVSDNPLVRLLLNDRVDVAVSENAGGVHLGENSLPVGPVKRFVNARRERNDFLIGVSCHSLESAKSSAREGADYIIFGPVFATPSKAAYGSPQGLALLSEVCNAVSVPVLAIGGITLQNAAACIKAGASGIAAIRLFQEAEDLTWLVQALRKSMSKVSAP